MAPDSSVVNCHWAPQALIHAVSLTPNLLQVEEDSLEVTAENRDAQMS